MHNSEPLVLLGVLKIFSLCYIERQQPAPGSPVIFCSQADTVLVDPPWQCVKVFTLFKMSFLTSKQEKRYPPPPEKHYWRHFKMKIPIDSIIPCFYQRWLHLRDSLLFSTAFHTFLHHFHAFLHFFFLCDYLIFVALFCTTELYFTYPHLLQR